MAFFDKLITNGLELGSRIGDSLGNTIANTGTELKQSTHRTTLQMELRAIDDELDKSYLLIGKKYVNYIKQTNEMPVVDIMDNLRIMDPKMVRREELLEEIKELEIRNRQQGVMIEKMKFEKEFESKKAALDKARTLDVISEAEYEKKINEYTAKLNNFEEYKKIETQYELGVIDKGEYDIKIARLGR